MLECRTEIIELDKVRFYPTVSYIEMHEHPT